MRKVGFILMLLIMTWLIIGGSYALASDISEAVFSGDIKITNNGTATTCVNTVMTLDTGESITVGYFSTTCNNTAIRTEGGSDAPYMPGANATYPWCIYVPSIGEQANLIYKLYVGDITDDLAGKIRYFPGTSGMTVSDDSSLEPGDSWSIEVAGRVNTDSGTDKYIAEKLGALDLLVSASVPENITANIYTSANLTPDGTNDPDAAWANDGNAIDDDVGTSATDGVEDAWSSYLELTLADNITCVGAMFVAESDATRTTANVSIYNGSWHQIYSDTSHPDADWHTVTTTTAYEDVSKARFSQYGITPSNIELYEFKFLQPTPAATVSATGVSSGESTVTISTDGIVSGGLVFNGTSTLVNTGNSSSFNIGTDNFSIELWAKHNSTDEEVMIGKDSSYVAGQWVLYMHQNYYMEFVHNNNTYRSSWVSSIDTNYHHLVCSGDRTAGTMYFYVDGAAAGTANISALPDLTNNEILYLGARNGSDRLWDGSLDEVRLYIGRCLDLTEAQYNYNSGNGRATPYSQTNLVGWWHLDEGSGTSTTDEIGNGDGTITSPSWSTGKVPSQFVISIDGAEIDGTRNVSVPDNTNDWAFFQNNVMDYVEYADITVGGTQAGFWEWELQETFSDGSENNNTATPTFRTSSSDSDVTAELISLDAITEAEATNWSLLETTQLIQTDDIPSAPAETYTEIEVTNLFLAPIFTALIAETDYESATFWYPVVILILGLVGIFINMGTRSILVQALVQALGMAFFSFTIIPWWCFIVFIPYALAVCLSSNKLPGGI